MVQIGTAEWVNVRHQIQHPMPLQYAPSCRDSDVMTGFDVNVGTYLEVRVNDD